MDRWLVAAPVLVGWLMMVRALDLHVALTEVLGDWWRRMASRGRHTVREVRRRQAREEAGVRDALARDAALADRVWVGAIGAWAERARGDGLHRSRVAV